MTQYTQKLVGAQDEVIARSGKIAHVYIATTGDRVWELREVNVSGDIKYKISAGVNIPHTGLSIPFKTALFAKVTAGTSGEINVIID